MIVVLLNSPHAQRTPESDRYLNLLFVGTSVSDPRFWLALLAELAFNISRDIGLLDEAVTRYLVAKYANHVATHPLEHHHAANDGSARGIRRGDRSSVRRHLAAFNLSADLAQGRERDLKVRRGVSRCIKVCHCVTVGHSMPWPDLIQGRECDPQGVSRCVTACHDPTLLSRTPAPAPRIG